MADDIKETSKKPPPPPVRPSIPVDANGNRILDNNTANLLKPNPNTPNGIWYSNGDFIDGGPSRPPGSSGSYRPPPPPSGSGNAASSGMSDAERKQNISLINDQLKKAQNPNTPAFDRFDALRRAGQYAEQYRTASGEANPAGLPAVLQDKEAYNAMLLAQGRQNLQELRGQMGQGDARTQLQNLSRLQTVIDTLHASGAQDQSASYAYLNTNEHDFKQRVRYAEQDYSAGRKKSMSASADGSGGVGGMGGDFQAIQSDPAFKNFLDSVMPARVAVTAEQKPVDIKVAEQKVTPAVPRLEV